MPVHALLARLHTARRHDADASQLSSNSPAPRRRRAAPTPFSFSGPWGRVLRVTKACEYNRVGPPDEPTKGNEDDETTTVTRLTALSPASQVPSCYPTVAPWQGLDQGGRLMTQRMAPRRADRMTTRRPLSLSALLLPLFGRGGPPPAHSFALTPMMSIGGVDLSERWTQLVTEGHIVATTSLKDDEDSSELQVAYGVKFQEDNLIEFVSIVDETGASPHRERIQGINETLTAAQRGNADDAVQCVYDGPYVAQLQLVRTLRPKRSTSMSSEATRSRCTPPPYDPSIDSFVVGPLRLYGESGEFHGEGRPRELAARLKVDRGEGWPSYWDVFHNVSPVDPRGHYLLLPANVDERHGPAWRDQSLSPTDCYDLMFLASTIEPEGSSVITFNSVGAGASQNHIHCHLWHNPPIPLAGRSCYAALQAEAEASFTIHEGLSISLLDYPCTCIKVSSSYSDAADRPASLHLASSALSKIVSLAQDKELPHNVALINHLDSRNGGVDAYVFFRRSEASKKIAGGFRGGGSEVLGLMHSTSKEQLDALAVEGTMECILDDFSFKPRHEMWEEVKHAYNSQSSIVEPRN